MRLEMYIPRPHVRLPADLRRAARPLGRAAAASPRSVERRRRRRRLDDRQRHLPYAGLDPAATAVTVAGQAVRAEQLLAALFVLLVAVVNYVGIHRAAIVQNVSTALKVGALAVLVVLGFALGGGQGLGAGAMLAQRAA